MPDRDDTVPSVTPPTSEARRNPHRAEPRFAAEGLACHAGRVLDLSGSGMRLLVSWKQAPRVGDPETYTFGEGPDAVSLMGTVRWVRPAGRLHKRAQVGVEFVGLTPAKRDALRRLAITGDLQTFSSADQDSVRVGYPDLYRMFGLTSYASQDDIRRAYHALAMELHPDRSPEPEAAARFAELTKAYSILRNKELRAKYDERLERERHRAA
jgi:hypothetical protein